MRTYTWSHCISDPWQSSDLALVGTRNQAAVQLLANAYGNKSVNNYLNPNAFARPATGTFGNVGKGAITGPGTWQSDVAVARTFQVTECPRMEFRAEAFNVTNSFGQSSDERQQQYVRPGHIRSRPENYAVRFEIFLLIPGDLPGRGSVSFDSGLASYWQGRIVC
jgi:hypothetical protein